MAKEGSTVGGLMDVVGTCVSMALQYGVPLITLVDKFRHARFEPAGMTSNKKIPFAKSLIDYIFLDEWRNSGTAQFDVALEPDAHYRVCCLRVACHGDTDF